MQAAGCGMLLLFGGLLVNFFAEMTALGGDCGAAATMTTCDCKYSILIIGMPSSAASETMRK
jgi:hypothetical protein